MPNRMVRDDLLTSGRYWACSPEARNLYVSVLLSADDCARFTGSNFALRTKCMAGTVSSERIEKLLIELMDADLIRVYQHDGARYLFLPRFRQRLRYVNSRYPAPPNGISDLAEIKSVLSQSQVSPKTAEVKRSEEKRSNTTAPSEKISLDAEGVWVGIPAQRIRLWGQAFPALNLEAELHAAAAWISANPKNRKSNYERFLTNWLKRAQDKAPRVDLAFKRADGLAL